jgi:hypothetical protein
VSETQRCYVCGQWDTLVDARVVVKSNDKYFDRVVAQCPRCFRFICSDHGEKLDLSGRKSWLSFDRAKGGDVTICCPFDPGVPLGDQSF